MVLEWLKKKDKFGESAVNKGAAMPDMGHDIWLQDTHGKRIRASVKSSLSVLKSDPEKILNTFTLATKSEEVREINIQVYFWLSVYSTPRISVPSMRQAAIVAWAPAEDLAGARFNSYKGEHRPAPDKKLSELRPMNELVAMLI